MEEETNAKEILTIFIPSYNRQKSLSRALNSIFTAIECSRYGNLVKVLVVDDYSTEKIEKVITEQKRANRRLEFKLHEKKCGVAEIAMLSCLQFIDTKYAWLLGNDDVLIPDSIDYLMQYLIPGNSSFFLLNFIGREKDGSEYDYYIEKDAVFHFKTGQDLFRNFGFATATTTFPCLCFSVAEMKAINVQQFIDISPIYSHSFSLFRAFHSSRCTFIPKPLVIFNHNEMAEEQVKLESRNRLFGRSAFYHASLGYVRQLKNISVSLGIPISQLANYREDELDKTTKRVIPTLSGFFAFNFSIAQLNVELYASMERKKNTMYTPLEGIIELQDFFDSIEIPELGKYFRYARGVYCSDSISQMEKTKEIFRIQMHACKLAAKYTSAIDEKHNGLPQIGLPFDAQKKLINAIKCEGAE